MKTSLIQESFKTEVAFPEKKFWEHNTKGIKNLVKLPEYSALVIQFLPYNFPQSKKFRNGNPEIWTKPYIMVIDHLNP